MPNWLIQHSADEEMNTNLPTSDPIWLERIANNMACSIRSFSGISDVDTHDSWIRLLSILFISGRNLEAILVKSLILINFVSSVFGHWLCLHLGWGMGKQGHKDCQVTSSKKSLECRRSLYHLRGNIDIWMMKKISFAFSSLFF